jgi:hypothetical protein
MAGFVLEGEWTGYTSAQRRIVHREKINHASYRVPNLRKLHAIIYADGTSLVLHLRNAMPREKVKEINRYGKLIREAEMIGAARVRVTPEGLVPA